jgi:hypothetical protein
VIPKLDGSQINIPVFEYEKLIYDFLPMSDFYNPLKHTFKLKHLWVMMPQVGSPPMSFQDGKY